MATRIAQSIRAASFRLHARRRHGDRRGSGHLALSAGTYQIDATARRDTERQSTSDDVGAACGTRRLRRGDGGRTNAAPRLAGRAIAGPHDYAQIPELVERSKRRVANFYSDMDGRLADVSFIAGKNFSAADITTLVAVDFATRALDIPVPAESRALRNWYDTVAARPSATA